MCFLVSGLSLEQVDILWHCLVEDAECYDDALHWFLNQVRSKDQHAMGMETYKHLFLEKVRTRRRRRNKMLLRARRSSFCSWNFWKIHGLYKRVDVAIMNSWTSI